MRITRRRMIVAMAGAATLPATTGSRVAAQEGAAPLGTPTEALVAAPGGKTELVVGQAADVTTLDPHMSNFSADITVTFNLFDNLLSRDRNQELQPMLATEWTLVDDTTWEFRLRPGVTFHTGDPFTAADVEFSIERTYDPEAETAVATAFATVADVVVVDDETVRFKTKAPDPLLPGRLASYGGQIVPKDYFARVGPERFAEAPIGTGPVRFVERVLDERVELERNDDYWGGPIAFERVVFRPIPELSARIAALETGEVDIISRVPPDQIARVHDLDNARVEEVLYNGLYVLAVNSTVEPLDDPRVKQALSLAIDRRLIIDELWQGHGAVPTGPAIPGDFAFDPSLPPLAYDPERARLLLQEAGYDGTPVVIETTDGDDVNDRVMAEAIAAMWEEVGVTADVQIIERAVRVDKQRTKSFLGLWWSHPASTVADPDGFMWRLLGPGGLHDYWRDEEFDRLGTEAQTSLDPALRERNYRRMFELFLENMPWLPILQDEWAYGVANTVEWYPYPNQQLDLRAENLRLVTE